MYNSAISLKDKRDDLVSVTLLYAFQYQAGRWWTVSRHSSGGSVPTVSTCYSARPNHFWLTYRSDCRQDL